MFKDIKKLGTDTIIYAVGSGLQSLINFLLIPLYTRNLDTADYGRLELLNTVLAVLNMIFLIGMASAIIKVANRDTKSDDHKKIASGTAFIFVVPITIIFTVLAWFKATELAELVLGNAELVNLVKLLLLANAVMIPETIFFSTLRSQDRAKIYSSLWIVRAFVILGLNSYFLIVQKMGIAGILTGNLIAHFLILIVFFLFVNRTVKFKWDNFLFRKLIKFGLPIIPASLAMWIMDLSDRYFLKHYFDFTEVGIYSLGYKLGFFLSVVLVTPFQMAWPTISYRLANEPDSKKTFARIFTYFFLLASAAALGISIFDEALITIMSPAEYITAATIVPLVAFSYVFYGLHFVLAQGIHIVEKTKYYPWVIIIPAVLNFGLNYFFVPRFGMMGAAITTIISFAIVIFLTYLVANKYYPVKQEWLRLFKIVIAVIIPLIISYFLPTALLSNILTGVLIFGLFILLLFVFGFFNKEEFAQLKGLRSMFKKAK
ncbi:MAG: polysaccharide biosynthesis C-terminal domain-containing protein [bacterium]